MDNKQRRQRIHFLLPRMRVQQQTRWRPTRRQVLWTVGIVATAVVMAYIGYFIPRTGFGQTEVKEGVQPSKTL